MFACLSPPGIGETQGSQALAGHQQRSVPRDSETAEGTAFAQEISQRGFFIGSSYLVFPSKFSIFGGAPRSSCSMFVVGKGALLMHFDELAGCVHIHLWTRPHDPAWI